jgi:hypothetical protein
MVLAGLLLLVLVGSALVLAFRTYCLHVAEQRVREAEARLDREDPRWRWDDILADRAVVPDEENSARPILAAALFLPPRWPEKPATLTERARREADEPLTLQERGVFRDLATRIADTPANQRLDGELAQDLRAELKALAPALAAAEPMARLPRGSFEISWRPDFLPASVEHTQRARAVAAMFALEAALRADDGKLRGALASVCGALNTGRSLGDEPVLISLLMRIACGNKALHSLERVLGQGEPSLGELEYVQRQLRRERDQSGPLLGYSFRAERAAWFGLIGKYALGEFELNRLEGMFRGLQGGPSDPDAETSWSSFQSWLYLRPLGRYNQAAILEWMTQLVDISELPPGEQPGAFAEWSVRMEERKRTSPHLFLAILLVPAAERVANAFHRYWAGLDCAQAALATERFRRERGRWPRRLAELVPRYLDRMPEDPFSGGPLCYRRTDEGVRVFSVGADHPDDSHPWQSGGTTVGFELWDVKHRRR